uniref:Uncharacterized protein n=1 Tax=Coccidioides posadasii RMSCC 3488 TaxID=454284 RepID=A0A0J6F339_COCPO|nr:hypothetical protein CPAG_03656 [Coccidioides posadasii RMSCC 3488]
MTYFSSQTSLLKHRSFVLSALRTVPSHAPHSRNLLPGQNSLPLPLTRATIPLPRSGDCERGGQRRKYTVTVVYLKYPAPAVSPNATAFRLNGHARGDPRKLSLSFWNYTRGYCGIGCYIPPIHSLQSFFGGFTQTTRYADSLIGGWQISLKSDVSQDPSGLAFLVLLEATSNNRASEKVFFISPARHFPFRLSFPFLGELHFLAARNFQPRKWLTQPMCHLERRSGQEAMTACRQDFIPPASSRCSGWARGTVLWNSVVALEIGSAVALQ